MNDKSAMWTLGFIFFAVLVLIGPFFVIWALNTLFPVLAIGYSLETWFAAAIIMGTIKSSVNMKS